MNDTADPVIRAKPRKGERAAQIRLLHDKYPELSHSAIARRVGCLPANVDQVLARYLGNHSLAQLRDYQSNQADVFDSLGMRAITSITDTHLSKSSALQLATVAAISMDKGRLARGQATSINVNALLDVAELIRQQKG